MADPNVQAQTPLKLSGGNDATKRYLSYYDQITKQISGQHTPIQAQVIPTPQAVQHIESPGELQAHLVQAPEPIEAARIDTSRFDSTYDDYAKEVSAYLRPYLETAMRERRDATRDARAAIDVDANLRGFGTGAESSWTQDAKLRQSVAEAKDIAAMNNEYLGQVAQQAFQAKQADLTRWLQGEGQNAQLAQQAAMQNAQYKWLEEQYNAGALTDAEYKNLQTALQVSMYNTDLDKWYSELASQIAGQNANLDLEAQGMNQSWEQYLQQLAWGWAGQMYGMSPAVRTVIEYKERPKDEVTSLYQVDPAVRGSITYRGGERSPVATGSARIDRNPGLY